MSALPPGVTGDETAYEQHGPMLDARTPAWHALAVDEVAARLVSDPLAGLASLQATARLAEVGRNEIEPVKRPTLGRVLLEALTEPFIVVLAAAGLLAMA